MTTATATTSAVNYDELFAYLMDELDHAAGDFIKTYLNETTDVEGVEYQNLRDEVTRVVNERLTIGLLSV